MTAELQVSSHNLFWAIESFVTPRNLPSLPRYFMPAFGHIGVWVSQLRNCTKIIEDLNACGGIR